VRAAATWAIITTRVSKERRGLLIAACACGLVAYLQRYDDASARLSGCLLFAALAGVVAALLQRGAGRFRQIELCEQSAPLYGRELARAIAVVPFTVVTIALAAYWSVAQAYSHVRTEEVLLSAFGAYAGALVALPAAVRKGAARALYVVAACAVPLLCFLTSEKAPVLLPCLLCTLFGFVALRQYGEALARYDPL